MNDTKERPTTCEIHIDPTMRTPLPLERPTAPIPTHVANAIGPSCRHCSPFLFARKAPRCGHHKDVALELPAITPIPEHLSHIILACRSCYPELFDTDNESNGGGALMTPMRFAIGSAHWNGLSKLVEEAGEVLQLAGKLMATGDDPNHWDGSDLTTRLEEELGDLRAAVDFFVDANTPRLDPKRIEDRARAKYAQFTQWSDEQSFDNQTDNKDITP